MIDLKPFCYWGNDRPSMRRPFRYGDLTYATDGRICVRVAHTVHPSDDADPGAPSQKSIEALFASISANQVLHEIPGSLPPVKFKKCEDCEGKGKIEVQPRDWWICDECDGNGDYQVPYSVQIGGCAFDTYYLRMIQALPNLRFFCSGSQHEATLAAPFTFDGGDGRLMPMKKQD